ncbi:MAG: mechanosensitive ion channel family protein [Sphingobium sp.]|nr:mechanosensitive ion channel family protein [Sphingobium sp.]MCP5398701.1 mechanosensitive ion channel family protein [Sphingomonas sp.]
MQPNDFHIAVGHFEWRAIAGLGIAALVALALHFITFAIIRRVSRKTSSDSDDVFVRAVYQPSRWLFVLLVLMTGIQTIRLGPTIEKWWTIGSTMTLAALVGWLAWRIVGALKRIVEASADITVEDNLTARRRTTRVRILNRIAQVTILFLTIAFMLLAIPSVRAIGVTLVASAGLAALAVGAAAQPALKNLIAGIQMAFTEPIRLDDVVIVEGEWGWIEDIRLTYVIVRIWDDRRLVVPVSYFLEKPFQNWTRETSHLLGTVFIYVDHGADIGALRHAWVAAVQANERWDGRVAILQVTDHRPDGIELRGLLSARDAPVAWDLRCEVREAMMDFLRVKMPEAMVKERVRLDALPDKRADTAPPVGQL